MFSQHNQKRIMPGDYPFSEHQKEDEAWAIIYAVGPKPECEWTTVAAIAYVDEDDWCLVTKIG